MSYPLLLISLTTLEAITDAVNRALIGVDRDDIFIFNSAFASEDITFEFYEDPSRTTNSLSTVCKQVIEHGGPMDTTHMLSKMFAIGQMMRV